MYYDYMTTIEPPHYEHNTALGSTMEYDTACMLILIDRFWYNIIFADTIKIYIGLQVSV
jgi:hypothetical protein